MSPPVPDRDLETYRTFVSETLALAVAFPPALRDVSLQSERDAFRACIRQAVERATRQYFTDQAAIETIAHQLPERRGSLIRRWIDAAMVK